MSALEIVMVAVAGALILFIVLATIIWKYYKKIIKSKENEFKVYNHYAGEGGVVLLGDSLTDFYPVSEYITTGRIFNRGIASNTTFDVLARLDDVTVLKPEKLFLQIGINDILRVSRKLTEPSVLVERIMKIASEFPNAKIHISSLYPINKKKSFISKVVCHRATNKRIMDVNAELEKACAQNGYTFINIYPLLLDDTGNLKKEYTVEGLHLTSAAYCIITEEIKKHF